MLTEQQLKQFWSDGYLIIPSFFSASEADTLRAEAQRLLDQLDLANHPGSIFKTSTEQGSQTQNPYRTEHNNNDYFLSSADSVGHFFEEHAYDKSGKLIVPINQAINKVGHALHELNPLYASFSSRPEVKSLVSSLGYVSPAILQSMIIYKQPKIGGKVDIHRDNQFLNTTPTSATGLWFALEDCHTGNGCLSFVPGSHRDGACTKRMVRKCNSPDPLDPNKNVDLIFTGEDKASYDPSKFVLGEVKKGSLVLIHGDVVHMSTANTSDKSRNIYTFHVIETHNTTYDQLNWLQSRRPFYHLLSKEEENKQLAKHGKPFRCN